MNKFYKIFLVIFFVMLVLNIVLMLSIYFNKPFHVHSPIHGFRDFPPDLQTKITNTIRNYYKKHPQTIKPEKDKNLYKFMKEFRREMRHQDKNDINQIKEIEYKLYAELKREAIDSVKITSLLDSLIEYQAKIKLRFIRYFLHKQSSLTPEQRDFLLRNMFREFKHQPRRKIRR